MYGYYNYNENKNRSGNELNSFLTSVCIWQPLSIYILTWITIWAFHNGFKFEASMYNMAMFVPMFVSNRIV